MRLRERREDSGRMRSQERGFAEEQKRERERERERGMRMLENVCEGGSAQCKREN